MPGTAGDSDGAGTAGGSGSGGEGGAPASMPLPDPRCAQAVTNAMQGSGTSVAPYLICLPQQLALLDTYPYTLDQAYALGADLDLATFSGPLSTYITNLEGTFDGRSHSISNAAKPLFSSVRRSGVVQDLNVSGVIEKTGQALVATSSEGTLRRVRASGTFQFGSHSGPLIGDNFGLVEDCSSSGTVESGTAHVGGLIGANQGTIRRSFSTVSVTGSVRVGGLLGTQFSGSVEQSYALGAVSAPDSVGGLVGSYFGGEISNCYARSPLVNGTEAGGLVGQLEQRDQNVPLHLISGAETPSFRSGRKPLRAVLECNV